ncbi:tumor necrosis factor receptor superfamily member 1B-like [Tiliqua scincoides]|uniref:tumor necrosis factor receptor superfamily member 1B-like n=1 Tax=Tiliqua scincoides TaxID=71010 RepID=UPI003462A4DC
MRGHQNGPDLMEVELNNAPEGSPLPVKRIKQRLELGLALSPQSCKAHENQYYDAKSQKCCYRCQPGSVAKKECPTDPHSDCRKPCPPDQFLNRKIWTPRCESCTSCPSVRDLVEKAPCTNFSDRVCMCRPGMRCLYQSPNACSLCVPVTPCQLGFGVKTGGNSNGETICEECPPGTFSDQESSISACKPHTNCSKMNRRTARKGNSTHDERCDDHLLSVASLQSIATRSTAASSVPLDTTPASGLSVTTREPLDEFSTSHFASILPVEKPSKEDGHDFTLVGASILCFFVLFAALLILWQRKACKKWIVPHQAKLSNQAKFCVKRIRKLSLEEKGEGEGDLKHLESLVGSPDESSLLETDAAPFLDPGGALLSQAGSGVLVEPQHLSHTSNCIEKIYIMRADTVIVGSVSEVPAGKICSTRDEDGSSGAQEEVKEGELVAHYPEQETEFCPTSSVTTPVEEEWEFPPSSEKALAV